MSYSKNAENLTLNLVTHGFPKFDRKKFLPPKNNNTDLLGSKPRGGGLWASPVDSEYGWRDFCEDNGFGLDKLEQSFEFNFVGRTIVIKDVEDLNKLPWKKSTLPEEISDTVGYFGSYIAYDLLSQKKGGVDAIYLTLEGLGSVTSLFAEANGRNLYGWDCETVLILNPTCCYLV